eukprot:CAMPEP_0198288606 /NCGR_PEP_ID=MMETSP1449-20131203/7051_1 /TAXON_ID=420275 /ORGANISM="Attheya septentrionalis, Strain CCMP2084" /LENGTH=515 /DNA_ID=CAMNT_0043986775 /DNA_START=506 /DNA_END=2053 /DNA_ORIENTATION=-
MSGSVLNTKSKLPPQPPYAQQQSHFPLVQKQQNHKVQQSSSKSQYVSMTQTDAISATVSRDDDFSKLGKMMSNDENDHQTATTAATNSYSLDDGSTIFSESGTEIIMPFKGSGVMVDGKHRSSTPYAAHSFKAGSHTFTVDTKYSLIRVVGSGAYGVVISAHDTSTNKKVAIKMVPRAFHDEVDAKRILREIKLLKHLKHENIISLLDMMPPLAHHVEDFNDVYIVADLMETDLHRIIYSKQPLTLDHVQYFVYQILRALKYIHSANILHRDLKPSNLLVNSNCDLKVCDLGLARGVMPEDDKNAAKLGGSMLLTEYVVTRWYRAPEIMLACHEYSKPIDVWSIGCIFAELLQRKPYFPGEDYIDQLNLITDKLGKLPDEDLDFVTSEKAKRFMRKLPDKEVPSLRRQFPGTPPEALDLLGKMLQIHPTKRITVCEALEHPFLAQLHCPEDEPVAETTFDFSFEDEKLHRVRLQELIWEEIGDFRPSCLPIPPRKDGSSAPQTKQRSTLGRLYSA